MSFRLQVPPSPRCRAGSDSELESTDSKFNLFESCQSGAALQPGSAEVRPEGSPFAVVMDNDNDVAVTATLARSERLHALAQLCVDRDSQLTVDGCTADKVVQEVISRVLARNWSRQFSGISVVDGAAM